MKVKAIQSFNDWEAGIRRQENEVFEITDERFEVLENNLKVSFSVSISDVLEIIEEEMSDITSEFLEVEEFPGTHYLSFYAYDNIIEYGFNTSIETSFGYDIFDNDLKLIKEQ